MSRDNLKSNGWNLQRQKLDADSKGRGEAEEKEECVRPPALSFLSFFLRRK